MKSWTLAPLGKKRFANAAFSAALILASVGLRAARAQPAAPVASAGAPASSGSHNASLNLPLEAKIAPNMGVVPSDANRFEYDKGLQSVPMRVFRQWMPLSEAPAESNIDERYFGTIDDRVQSLTLKQAVYLALRNNPEVESARLDPVAATEGVRMANGLLDPDFLANIDQIKTVQPVGYPFEAVGNALSVKLYDWNFALNKVLKPSNGVLTLLFSNTRRLTNSRFTGVVPSYVPTLTMGLSQPLLRDFGWKFATINVRLAESAQRQSQLNYAQELSDFVDRAAGDYWSVVAAEENLRVAQEALKFNEDLVRVNRISVEVGTLARIDLQEAQSAEATAQANVYTARAALKDARAVLREDVMLSPRHTFVPEEIEPADRPNPSEPVGAEEERALETAISNSPSLAALRENIRGQRLQVKYQENQLLPSIRLITQFSLNSLAGVTPCKVSLGGLTNCVTPSGAPGFEAPFSGGYDVALNRLFGFRFYSYSILAFAEMPLDNAPIKAALAQAKVQYRQLRERYRAQANQITVDVESALANLAGDIRRVKATAAATGYARQALHDERERFRVGMATTHDLLQFESQLVSAEGNQVQAETDLEKAKIALRHADSTLLESLQISFQVHDPHETPWYASF